MTIETMKINANIIHQAVGMACAILDRVYPGYEDGPVNSKFAGNLEDAIIQLLIANGVQDDE